MKLCGCGVNSGTELSSCRLNPARSIPSSDYTNCTAATGSGQQPHLSSTALVAALQPLIDAHNNTDRTLNDINMHLRRLDERLTSQARGTTDWLPQNRDIALIGVMLLLQLIVAWCVAR